MSWRVVVITNRCKLDYSMNYMVVRGEEVKRVLLDEIAVLLIENNAISMTGCLLTELLKKKIRVILCDEKRSPQAELQPYYGAHNSSLKVKNQIAWSDEVKTVIWTSIVSEKIKNQSVLLYKVGKAYEGDMLAQYVTQIIPGDITNREGHAAKVYFNSLFGLTFSRNDEENVINSALNYGYALLLSAFNREVTLNGYLTQLGLKHDNQFNPYNLSCDLMEPFRIIVDERVKSMSYSAFATEEKHDLVRLLHEPIEIAGNDQTLLNAIKIYTKSVFDSLNEENENLIKFPFYEL